MVEEKIHVGTVFITSAEPHPQPSPSPTIVFIASDVAVNQGGLALWMGFGGRDEYCPYRAVRLTNFGVLMGRHHSSPLLGYFI
jgi:hypothetical protein